MPKGPKRICRKCKKLHRNKSGYCDDHEPEAKSNWEGWRKRKGSTTKRGYGYQWEQIKKRIIIRDKGLCQPCLKNGRPTPYTSVDHIKPKAQRGTDDEDNLQCICKPCHEHKTATERA
jgi:5-methylcytosine-specific restriction protein A